MNSFTFSVLLSLGLFPQGSVTASESKDLCGKYKLGYLGRSNIVVPSLTGVTEPIKSADGAVTFKQISYDVILSAGEEASSREIFDLRKSVLNLLESEKEYCVRGYFDRDGELAIYILVPKTEIVDYKWPNQPKRNFIP